MVILRTEYNMPTFFFLSVLNTAIKIENERKSETACWAASKIRKPIDMTFCGDWDILSSVVNEDFQWRVEKKEEDGEKEKKKVLIGMIENNKLHQSKPQSVIRIPHRRIPPSLILF